MTDSQRILDAIRRFVRVLRLADRAAQTAAGLSSAQLFVLSELGKTPSLSLNDLAERTRTDQSSASVVVARLVDAGLVTRQRAADDARRLELTLTKAGRAALRNAPAPAQQQLLSILDRMPDMERKGFADTFTRIVEAMGAAEGAAPMLFEDDSRSLRGNKHTPASGTDAASHHAPGGRLEASPARTGPKGRGPKSGENKAQRKVRSE